MVATETVVLNEFETSAFSAGKLVPEGFVVYEDLPGNFGANTTNIFFNDPDFTAYSGTGFYRIIVREYHAPETQGLFSIETSVDYDKTMSLSFMAAKQSGYDWFSVNVKAVVAGSVIASATHDSSSFGIYWPPEELNWGDPIVFPVSSVSGAGTLRIEVRSSPTVESIPDANFAIDYLTAEQIIVESVELPTKEFSLNTVGVDAAITKHTVSLGSKSFSLSTLDVEVVEDKIIDFSPKIFSLSTYPVSIFSSEHVLVYFNTKVFDFNTFDIYPLKDEIVHFPTKEFTHSSIDVETFYGFHVDAGQKTFSLQLYDTELDLQYSRDFPLLTNSPYTYEIKGVNASCVSGFGTFDILSEGEIIRTSVEFNTSSGNTALSGTINKGSDLTVNVYAGENLYRSLRIDFALLRVEE